MEQVRSPEEDARVQAVREARILDTDAEQPFDDLVLIATETFQVSIALINFVDRDRQWFKARIGVDAVDAPRHAGFCSLVVDQRETLVIEDIAVDPAWTSRAAALGRPVRFYAGAPIFSAGGHVLGTVCIADERPRTFSSRQRDVLQAIARQVVWHLEGRRNAGADDLRQRERRGQELLLQSQKLQAIAQLAGGIAHEYNNILTVIFGYLSLLELEFEEGDPRRADIRHVSESADRASHLTRQLLAFSRHQRLSPQLVDLNVLLTRLTRMLGRVVGEHVQVSMIPYGAPCPVRVDPAHVEQVVLNLAINARDAMPEGGTLRVETRPITLDAASDPEWADLEAGDYIALIVTDTGHGMSSEVQARVFEPFFSTKAVGKGTGLGLSTAYGIVGQSGGHIRVASQPDKGSTFTILLPRVEADAAATTEGALANATPRGSETIVLVEDDQALRGPTAAALRRHGYWVLEASHGLDALAICARQAGPIHLVITDLVVPGMTGTGLAQRLLRTRPETRVLYLSSRTTSREAADAGATMDLIARPFTPDELLERVRAMLDRPGPPDRSPA